MKDDTLYRYHIMESIDKITTYIDGIDQNDFANTPL
jgi:uncharacterized protein with HEPN domain